MPSALGSHRKFLEEMGGATLVRRLGCRTKVKEEWEEGVSIVDQASFCGRVRGRKETVIVTSEGRTTHSRWICPLAQSKCTVTVC